MKKIDISVESLARMKDAVIGIDVPSSDELLDDLFNIIYLKMLDESVGFIDRYPTFASIGGNVIEVYFNSPYFQYKTMAIEEWKKKFINALTDCWIDDISEKYINILDEDTGVVYSFVNQKRSLRVVLRVYDEKLA